MQSTAIKVIPDNICDICKQTFTRKTHLISHINALHLNQKPHKCLFCCYNTYHKHNFKNHMRAFHPDSLTKQVKNKNNYF